MAQIATTIEQSKKLIELGIDVNTSDMYYYKEDVFDYALSVFNGKLLVKGNYKPNAEDTIPAWSLSALIGLMPLPILHNTLENKWRIVIYRKNGLILTTGEDTDLLFDAAFEMMCYLLENKIV